MTLIRNRGFFTMQLTFSSLVMLQLYSGSAGGSRDGYGMSSRRKVAIGVAGHIASGKSLVRRVFEKCGARGLDWDDVARVLLDNGSPSYEALVQTFGSSVLARTGEINRNALSSLVWESQHARLVIHQLIYRTLKREIADRIERFKSSGRRSMIVVEVPLLSAEVAGLFDHCVWVECDRNTLIARLAARDLIPLERAKRMVDVCELGSVERRLCHHIIDNSGYRRATRRQVKALYQRLLHRAHAIH